MRAYILTDLQSEIKKMVYYAIRLGEAQDQEKSKDHHTIAQMVLDNLEYCAGCKDIKMSPQVREDCIVVSKYIQVTDSERFPERYIEYALCNMIEDILSLFERYGTDAAEFPVLELQELLCGIVEVEQINEVKDKLLKPQDMDIQSYVILKELMDEISSEEVLLDLIHRIFSFKGELYDPSVRYADRDAELEKILNFMLDKDIFKQKDNPVPMFLNDCNVVKEEIETKRQERLEFEAKMRKRRKG